MFNNRFGALAANSPVIKALYTRHCTARGKTGRGKGDYQPCRIYVPFGLDGWAMYCCGKWRLFGVFTNNKAAGPKNVSSAVIACREKGGDRHPLRGKYRKRTRTGSKGKAGACADDGGPETAQSNQRNAAEHGSALDGHLGGDCFAFVGR
jgi:hypothetical protein